ncbi:methionyl aminopeptidase [Rickenella mellea]|uniref:Methionine aminopeptidase n=1 Tax=Rickenella mellea TaxID=50990 RepID=A0A4R5XIA2_9AGAM|nr:methionyl aminopeptidase [Rickenella mellea]
MHEDTDFGHYSIILPEEPPVWGTSHIIPRGVPPRISRPQYVNKTLSLGQNDEGVHDDPYDGDGRIRLGSQEEKRLRNAAKLARLTLSRAYELAKAGVTTNSIDAELHKFIIEHNAYPSPLHYASFPRSCCTSVNNIIVHGIPDDRKLEDGDIVNIDVTVYLDGFHGDTSQTFLIGNVDKQGTDLVQATNDAMWAGIRACGPGKPLKNIGRAISDVATERDYSVSTQFTGHGIGTVFHRPPWILNHRNDEPGLMLPGHCFTIEPCLVQGSNPRAWLFPDGWTASTENGARSAQAEHMVLITESGVDVLTQ